MYGYNVQLGTDARFLSAHGQIKSGEGACNMQILMRGNGYIRKLEEWILIICVLAMMVILCTNVVLRTFFNYSLVWAEEISSILSVYTCFVGVSYCARKGRHIVMSVLFDNVGKIGKKIFLYVSSSITSIAMFYLAYRGTVFVVELWELGKRSNALLIPLWILYMFVPIGFLLAGIQYFLIFCLNIKEKDIAHTCLEPMDDLPKSDAVEDEGGEKTK